MMSFEGVYRVSDQIETIPDAEIQFVESQVGFRFPTGYSAYLNTLGTGVYCDFLRVLPPARVADEYQDFQTQLAANFTWNADRSPISRDRVIEAVVVALTEEDDALIFHPDQPDDLYLLPVFDDQIYAAGSGLAAALDWLFTSNVLLEPVTFRYFLPNRPRAQTRLLATGLTLSFDEFNTQLLALSLHDHAEIKASDQTIQLFVKDFAGIATVYFFTDYQMAQVVYEEDLHESAALQRLIAWLEEKDFAVTETGVL